MAATEAAPDLLRFATAGSVDDGKSSLIGRLLYDSKAILEDQMRAIEHASRQRGAEQVELALLTDGLRAEREQNITIDVAYRYFATARRKFIIADTPGHLQYTRNMVTGTSTADLSVVLVDARKGVLTQSRRHAAISNLLGIRQIVVAVNKMDLVDYDAEVFRAIQHEFRAFTDRLGVPSVTFIPISALLGDNVVDPSERMDWYLGPTLLQFLEEVPRPDRAGTALRLPVQYVVRPHQDFRGFAGRVEGGSVSVGDEVTVASNGRSSRVRSIHVAGREALHAGSGQPVVVTIEDEIDISRGDLLFGSPNVPTTASRFEAVVCWLQETPLEIGRRYTLLHTTRRISAVVESVVNRIDVDTLEPRDAAILNMNDLGRLVIRTSGPLYFDPYSENPSTGSFVLVDPGTNVTVAAGMVQGVFQGEAAAAHRTGRAVWLGPWSSRASTLAADLRAFGRSVVSMHSAPDESASSVVGRAEELTIQGFDVLVSFEGEDGPASVASEPTIEELLATLGG